MKIIERAASRKACASERIDFKRSAWMAVPAARVFLGRSDAIKIAVTTTEIALYSFDYILELAKINPIGCYRI